MLNTRWVVVLTPLVATLVVLEVIRVVAHRRQKVRRWEVAGAVVRRCVRPAWFVAAMIVAELTFVHDVNRESRDTLSHTLAIALIVGITWLGVELVYAMSDIALVRLERALGTRDNRRARRARTQLLMLRRVIAVAAIVIAAGAILLTFTRVRALGASMLASAGIAGAIAGVAARPTLGNLIAGLQIAFSDMLRMDDVIVVNTEWGRVDDITLTYVVMRTWDERRLIIPTSWFVDNPFENWTRHEARVIGTVLITLDFAVPVQEVRDEVQRILEASPLWDRREWVVQVTEIGADGVELRMLMSAADAASAWDLRCEVRERLLGFLREQFPESLPRTRVEAVTAPLSGPPDWAALDPYGDNRAEDRTHHEPERPAKPV